MAMVRKPRPVTPSRRRTMGEFLRDLFSRDIEATDLHVTEVPAGTRPAIALVFVEDPDGPVTIQQDVGPPLVGRYDRVITRIPRFRIVSAEYTDPRGNGGGPRNR